MSGSDGSKPGSNVTVDEFSNGFQPSNEAFKSYPEVVDSTSDFAGSVNSSEVPFPVAEAPIVDGVGATEMLDIASLGAKPHAYFMQLLDSIHVNLGIPYWEAIAVTAVMIRVALLPLTLNSIRTGARMQKMQPELGALNARYIDKEGGAVPKERAQEYALEYKELATKYQVNPLRAFLMPLFQIPLSICAFMGIRAMDQYYVDYQYGGGLWFENLVAADPTYILPIVNSASFLAIIEMGRYSQTPATTVAQAQQQKLMRNVMRVLGVGMLPVTSAMPAVSIRQLKIYADEYQSYSFNFKIHPYV